MKKDQVELAAYNGYYAQAHAVSTEAERFEAFWNYTNDPATQQREFRMFFTGWYPDTNRDGYFFANIKRMREFVGAKSVLPYLAKKGYKRVTNTIERPAPLRTFMKKYKMSRHNWTYFRFEGQA